LKYLLAIGFLFFLIACSTKKNSFVSRNSHALSTKYNILYNGGISLDAGINELKSSYKDNFWQRLPVERMQISEEALLPGQAKNVNFDRAETKAIKAIQKHSMNIAGTEKNPQMDEAHLMLGKARYYDQRFIPALEAFNYILYKYPSSDKIYEAKIWREKTNIRMEREALAANNLRRLLKDIKFKDQIFADANAILAQAYLNLEVKDSALIKLKLATKFTKLKEEKARYRFILGQLYEEFGYKDSAYATYQSVIDMKRKSPKQYVIQAHARQAQQFDFAKGDTVVFLKKFDKLLKDRENRPFLDVLNHQLGLFYDKNKKSESAIKYYNKSLKTKSQDAYLIASNYRNLAEIYFDKAKYLTAGQYFDSTLVQLNAKSREYKFIKKKSENLVDVIKFEEIARRNDSILKVVSFS
jgi:tetratricopeptide (TPR) repeat protein